MTDITKTVAPKTDQLNADDLVGGRKMTIKITGVKGSGGKDQPISISFEGDNGKPWKPCLGNAPYWAVRASREACPSGRSISSATIPDLSPVGIPIDACGNFRHHPVIVTGSETASKKPVLSSGFFVSRSHGKTGIPSFAYSSAARRRLGFSPGDK